MLNIWIETRQTLIRLCREWTFSIPSIVTLALGVGVTIGASWIFYAALIGPLPYPAGNRLVSVSLTMRGNPGMARPMSPVAYEHFRTGIPALADAAFYHERGYNLDVGGHSTRISVVETTGSLFSTLGVKPLLGQVFDDQTSQPGQPRVVVLSAPLWQADFGGRTRALGETLDLNGRTYTVIGVMPPGFRFPDRAAALWIPYPFTPYDFRYFQLTAFRGHLIGRLAPASSIDALNNQVRTLTAALVHRFPNAAQKFFTHFSAHAESWRNATVGPLRMMLELIGLASLLLLLVVWFNLANLFLARGIAKRGELLLHEFLGAAPKRLFVRFLLEAFWIGLTGTLLGLGIAVGLLDWMQGIRILPSSVSVARSAPLVVTILSLILAGASILVMTITPLVSIQKADLGRSLREAGSRSGISRGSARTRRALIASQIALATALAGVSLLLVHTLFNLAAVQPGFQTTHTFSFDVDLPSSEVKATQLWPTLTRLKTELRRIPGVQAVGITSGLPFGRVGSYTEAVFPIPWSTHDPMQAAYLRGTDTGYLRSLGLDPLGGRLFAPEDARSSSGVAVIDRRTARELYGNHNPLGRIFTFDTPNNTRPGLRFRVIGLVPTVRNRHLSRPPRTGTVYLDAPQVMALNPAWFSIHQWAFVIRSTLSISALEPTLRRSIHRTLPWLPLYHLRTLQSRLSQSLKNRDIVLALVGLFALGALLLAAVGLYGVESYLVNRRLREFGIRAALGADRPSLVRLVLKESARLFVIGLIAGLSVMYALGRIFAALLYGISPNDPLTIGAVIIALALVLFLATWAPALRASRIRPAVALQRE